MSARPLDVLGAAVGLVLLAPLAAVAALVMRVESGGPTLFRARRMGRDGRPFTMFKLRTMRSVSGARVTAGDDLRTTPVGRVLRALHIDEWPQLWNVLRGEMSLVGPRPEDPAFVDLDDPRWQRVLSVRPGITGPTQLIFAAREARELRGFCAEGEGVDGEVGEGGELERAYVRDVLPAKLASDADYVVTRSLRSDLFVLVRTLTVPFRRAA